MGFIDKKESKNFFIVTKIIFQINAFQIFNLGEKKYHRLHTKH